MENSMGVPPAPAYDPAVQLMDTYPDKTIFKKITCAPVWIVKRKQKTVA